MARKQKETLEDLGKHEEELVQGKALSELQSFPKEEVSAAIEALSKESGTTLRMVADVNKKLVERDELLSLYDRMEKEVDAIAKTKGSPIYLLNQAIEEMTKKAKALKRTVNGGEVTKIPPNHEIWGAIDALVVRRDELVLIAKKAACTVAGKEYEKVVQAHEENESLWETYKSDKED